MFAQILSVRSWVPRSRSPNAIEFAAQWYAQAKAGATWASYTQTQSNLSWNYVLAMIDRLRVAFQAVAATDPAIEKELPNFTKLLGARQAVAAKAVGDEAEDQERRDRGEQGGEPPRKGTKSSTQATPTQAPAGSGRGGAGGRAPGAPAVTPVASSANGVNGAGTH